MALLAYTGVRLEELHGLMWEDVDLDNRFCIVKQVITHPKNSHYPIDTPKSADSNRTIPHPLPLVEILRPSAQISGYILGGGEPWCCLKMVRVFKHAKKHLSICGFNNHDFRTTFASQVCEDWATSKECAALLGHANTCMVERIYARARHESTMK